MQKLEELSYKLQREFLNELKSTTISVDELTIEVESKNLLSICQSLKDNQHFKFEMLMDIAGVDYLDYGVSEWEESDTATYTGFSRGVEKTLGEEKVPTEEYIRITNSTHHDLDARGKISKWNKPRFAVVYHLLSIQHNQRLRVRTFALGEPPLVPSVINIWNSANWYEREAFDLFGILFDGHPDLRRILTDYGFIGHPFRKDFPLIGQVEMRYSAKDGRVVYEPVSIAPRTLVPKMIPAYEKGE